MQSCEAGIGDKAAVISGYFRDKTNHQFLSECRDPCVCVHGRLFTYPPPPAVGGITVTNEDLYCLNDGEFLNDVIIEFYIK